MRRAYRLDRMVEFRTWKSLRRPSGCPASILRLPRAPANMFKPTTRPYGAWGRSARRDEKHHGSVAACPFSPWEQATQTRRTKFFLIIKGLVKLRPESRSNVGLGGCEPSQSGKRLISAEPEVPHLAVDHDRQLGLAHPRPSSLATARELDRAPQGHAGAHLDPAPHRCAVQSAKLVLSQNHSRPRSLRRAQQAGPAQENHLTPDPSGRIRGEFSTGDIMPPVTA